LAFGASAAPPVYVVKYRVSGRQRFFTIGPHGSPWTPDEARKEAKRLLGLIADGKDPADERASAALRGADTFRKIADQYLKHAKQKQRPRTHSELERYLLVTWKPLHLVPVVHIRRRHVAARIAEIATDHGAVTAARARAACRPCSSGLPGQLRPIGFMAASSHRTWRWGRKPQAGPVLCGRRRSEDRKRRLVQSRWR